MKWRPRRWISHPQSCMAAPTRALGPGHQGAPSSPHQTPNPPEVMYKVGYHPLHWEPKQPVIATTHKGSDRGQQPRQREQCPNRGNSISTRGNNISDRENSIAGRGTSVPDKGNSLRQREGPKANKSESCHLQSWQCLGV